MSSAARQQANTHHLLQSTLELPKLPPVLSKLGEAVADADATAESVGRVLGADPAVSAHMLRIVNSAYYGPPVRVSTIGLAVSVLGFNMTRKVALAAAVFSVFGRQRDQVLPFDPGAFWQHATFTGVAARAIGQQSGNFVDSHTEDLYLAGLLHDIGAMLMFEQARPKYLACLHKVQQQQRPQLIVETEEFGFTHADVGAALAIKWSLPEDLAIAIRYHHAPARDPFHRPLSSLVHLADHLASNAGKPCTAGARQASLDNAVYEQVGLDKSQVDALMPRIVEDWSASELPW